MEIAIREAWRRAEACCECANPAHGHPAPCAQFLIWGARGETGRGGWEVRRLQEPGGPAWEILCAPCYAKASGRLPQPDDQD